MSPTKNSKYRIAVIPGDRDRQGSGAKRLAVSRRAVEKHGVAPCISIISISTSWDYYEIGARRHDAADWDGTRSGKHDAIYFGRGVGWAAAKIPGSHFPCWGLADQNSRREFRLVRQSPSGTADAGCASRRSPTAKTGEIDSGWGGPHTEGRIFQSVGRPMSQDTAREVRHPADRDDAGWVTASSNSRSSWRNRGQE